MAVTKRLQVRLSSEMLADGSNGGKLFLTKDVMIFAHRYTVAGGDYTATDVITIEFDGAQEILYMSLQEETTAIAALAYNDPDAISGRQGLTTVAAATDAASIAVQLFAIVRV